MRIDSHPPVGDDIQSNSKSLVLALLNERPFYAASSHIHLVQAQLSFAKFGTGLKGLYMLGSQTGFGPSVEDMCSFSGKCSNTGCVTDNGARTRSFDPSTLSITLLIWAKVISGYFLKTAEIVSKTSCQHFLCNYQCQIP